MERPTCNTCTEQRARSLDRQILRQVNAILPISHRIVRKYAVSLKTLDFGTAVLGCSAKGSVHYAAFASEARVYDGEHADFVSDFEAFVFSRRMDLRDDSDTLVAYCKGLVFQAVRPLVHHEIRVAKRCGHDLDLKLAIFRLGYWYSSNEHFPTFLASTLTTSLKSCSWAGTLWYCAALIVCAIVGSLQSVDSRLLAYAEVHLMLPKYPETISRSDALERCPSPVWQSWSSITER